MTYVDTPNKKQKHPHYEHRAAKLDQKDNEFSSKKFHHVRKVSTHKKLLKSFGRIGMCLNDKPASIVPTDNLDKVCFILVNDYDNGQNDLGVGPLNDGYLVGLKHHRLGFKVFYLYNSRGEEFATYLAFFMFRTREALTVFYSGREGKGDGIEFSNGSLSKNYISEVISKNYNKNVRALFITDCIGGGSVFDIYGCSNMISLSAENKESLESKEYKRLHGIFTYYFSKITSDSPNITPNRLAERMNPSLNRFNEVFTYELSSEDLGDTPIFFN